MTNYNERLDEVLFNLTDLSYASFTTQEEADRVADQLDYDRAEAKQAITSLIKELVEEAEPMVTSVDVALEVAKQRELALLERMEDLNFQFMEPCEPDCSDVRHARHEGSWEHYWRMKAAIQKEKEKL